MGQANREVGGTAAAVYAGLRSPTKSPPPCPTLRIPSATKPVGWPVQAAGQVANLPLFQAGWQPAPRNDLADRRRSVTIEQ